MVYNICTHHINAFISFRLRSIVQSMGRMAPSRKSEALRWWTEFLLRVEESALRYHSFVSRSWELRVFGFCGGLHEGV